jgi:hypothetical protein
MNTLLVEFVLLAHAISIRKQETSLVKIIRPWRCCVWIPFTLCLSCLCRLWVSNCGLLIRNWIGEGVESGHRSLLWYTVPELSSRNLENTINNRRQFSRCSSRGLILGPSEYIRIFTISAARFSSILKYVFINFTRSRDSVVGIATSYGLDGRGVGVRVPVGSKMFFSLNGADRLWCPPKLLSNG